MRQIAKKIDRPYEDSEYYLMQSYRNNSDATLSEKPRLKPPMDNWYHGKEWTEIIPEPLEFFIYEEDQGRMRSYFPVFPLMREDLVEALVECGVDNLQQYKTVIKEVSTGKIYTNYKAINVVGVVSLVDQAKSDSAALGIGDAAFYHSITFDSSKGNGQLLFRLKESVSKIIVHKKVKDYLLEKGFSDIEFQHPNDFSG